MSAKRRRSAKSPRPSSPTVGELRVIGGKLRGSKIAYSGDARTRPMKDRVREAAFNLLGPAVKGKHAIDLFAGTGALGLEAISRGAVGATFLEQHFRTADLIRQNAASLRLDQVTDVVAGNTFLWTRRPPDWETLATHPWVVLCSPPYDFYIDRFDEVLSLLTELLERAPDESMFLVESDTRFDFQQLENLGSWDIRQYSPAVLGLLVVNRPEN